MPTDAPEPLVPVTTYMEESLAPDFQAWAQQALTALRSGRAVDIPAPRPATPVARADEEAPFEPLTSRQALERFPDAWANPAWKDDDQDLARATWLVSDLGQAKTRAVITELLDGRRVVGSELAEQVGYSPRGLPPALKHIATRCRQVERAPMWCFERDAEGNGTYWMEGETLAVFSKVFEQRSRT